MFKRPGLKFKILTLILIFIITSALILTFSTYIKLKDDIYQKNAEVFQSFVNTFYSEKNMVIKKYSMALDILLENRAILKAFKDRDRKTLGLLVDSLYNTRLKPYYNIDQFQFHTPPAKSFYRAHAPDKYGDDLSAFRKTVLLANKEKNMVTGFEVGRGGLGLRVVKPVWYNYDFIGTVELGGNIENLLATPFNSTGVDYAVGIYTKSLQRSKYFYSEKNRYTYKGMYMYNYSSPIIKTLITQGRFDSDHQIISMNGNYYMVKSIVLKDFSSNRIGHLLLSRDTTAEVLAMHKELTKQILIIFSYAVAITILLTFILVKLIFHPLEEITDHISSVHTGDVLPSSPITIKGDSEISMLADAFNFLSARLADSFEKINNQMNEIQEINTSLEKRVAERTEQLENTNTRLKNAMAEIQMADEAKSEFLASMSHEIRTPMNAVLGLSYLLMQTELTSRQYDYISKIRNSANMLLEIINDVLDFSKIEAGKLELDRSPFNLKEVIHRLGGMLDISVSKKNVRVDIDVDDNIPDYLFGDQLRVTQVLNNLGTNASKFTEKGSISISAKMLTKNETYAKIKVTVSDTGIGIPADKIPILFDSFTQVKRKDKKNQGGSGLGLSITKKILDAMNSDIHVESREGQGSVFTFNLTMEIADKSDMDMIRDDSQKFSGKRILICEKDTESQSSATVFFRENMADVLCVTNQYDLLKQVNNNIDCNNTVLFDLIVLNTETVGSDIFDSICAMNTGEKKLAMPPVVLISDDSRKASSITEKLTGQRVFVVQKKTAPQKLPELSTDLLSYDKMIRPDIECFKRNKQANSGIKTLIVDDNDLNLQVITEFADMLGISYKTAVNGVDAIKCLEEDRFDIIFMDITMPEMDGITAAEIIRKNPKYSKIPIYALSASTMPDDIEKCRRAGMNGHIAKPVKLQDITMALQDCMGSYLTQKQAAEASVTLPENDGILNTELAVSYLNGNRRLYAGLLKKYYAEYFGLAEKSQDVVQSGDHEKIKSFFHTIKGVARTIGAEKLSSASEKLESAAAVKTAVKGTEDYKTFRDIADETDRKLDSFFRNQDD